MRKILARGELAADDFILCAEVRRLIALFDKVQNATISKVEVRAGIPRRISLEHHFAENKISSFACREVGRI
jgi:hypothetical protein